MLLVLSTLVVAIVIAGLLNRRRPIIHLRLMTVAFVIDLGLVLYIEATRHAVDRVLGPAGALVWFHAVVSTLVLAIYVIQITLGHRMLAGRSTPLRAHLVLGITFCVLRGLSYATAFLVPSPDQAPLPQQTASAARPASAPAVAVPESE